MGGWTTATGQRDYINRHKAFGLCISCNYPAAPGRVRCTYHLAKRREYQPPPPPPPTSEPILQLVSYLSEDKRNGVDWRVSWNRRLRQTLASVPAKERGFWRDVLRSRHVRVAFRQAYLNEGERLQLASAAFQRFTGHG